MDTRKSAMKYIGKDSFFFEFFLYRERKRVCTFYKACKAQREKGAKIKRVSRHKEKGVAVLCLVLIHTKDINKRKT
jgi:hypothetical protein